VRLAAITVAALLAACRGDRTPPRAAPATAAPAAPTGAAPGVVPKLPQSPDGAVELRAIDRRIELHRDQPKLEIALLLERATYRGHVEDYVEAIRRSTDLVAATPDDREAWATRTRALAAVHDFAAARAALARVQALATDRSQWLDLATALDEATGARAHALEVRTEAARLAPTPTHLTLVAADLAFAGRLDDAIALVPEAAAAVHQNSAELFAWLLFQWGRLYEQHGDLAAARRFYEAARARLPGYLEVTVHLAQTMIATGDTPAATALVESALSADTQPALLELGAQLQLASRDAAKAEWDRYVQALPEAFSDHAARFYLGVGADPGRALALARANLANRDVPEARALVVEAALAANDPEAACAVVAPLIAAPVRAQRFTAWRALARCGRAEAADRLAKDLGITP
jgi:tetratricopeptide (TPR) repeat protein